MVQIDAPIVRGLSPNTEAEVEAALRDCETRKDSGPAPKRPHSSSGSDADAEGQRWKRSRVGSPLGPSRSPSPTVNRVDPDVIIVQTIALAKDDPRAADIVQYILRVSTAEFKWPFAGTSPRTHGTWSGAEWVARLLMAAPRSVATDLYWYLRSINEIDTAWDLDTRRRHQDEAWAPVAAALPNFPREVFHSFRCMPRMGFWDIDEMAPKRDPSTPETRAMRVRQNCASTQTFLVTLSGVMDCLES